MIRHSKSRNVAILFETLIKSTTQSIANNDDIRASRIFYLVKKHFMCENEMRKALNIYTQLLYNTSKNEHYAFDMIDNLVKEYISTIDANKLLIEIKSLLRGIKSLDKSVNHILNTRIPNYKLYASFSSLVENSKTNTLHAKDISRCKEIITEHFLCNKAINNLNEISKSSPVDIEKEKMNKLAIIIAVKNFKNKYRDLNEDQKEALMKYFTSDDATFTKYIQRKFSLFNELCEIKKKKIGIDNVKFKLETLLEKLEPINSCKSKITDSQFEDILKVFELKENLKLL